MKQRTPAFVKTAIALAVAAVLTPSGAAPVSWGFNGDGYWDTPSNWTPGAPVNGDDVVINVAGLRTTTFRTGTLTLGSLAVTNNTLSVTGGSLAISGAYSNSGSGSTLISGGTLTLNGASALGAFNMSGGTLAGAGAVTIGGAATWTNGAMSGTGSTTFNGALALGSNNPHGIISRTVNFAGTTTWDNSPGGYYGGRFQTGSAATLNNTGTWLDKNSSAGAYIANEYGGAASTFNNSGSYVKSGVVESDIAITFNNTSTGSLSVSAGTLGLGGGGTSTGAINVVAGAALNFYGGTFALSNLSPLTGTGQLLVSGSATLNTTGSNGFAGQLAISGGTFSADGPFSAATFNMSGGALAGAGAVTIGGAATWTNGAMSGTGSTTFNGALALSSNNPHGIISRTVNFAGTTTWDNSPGGYYGGRFQTGSAATLNNTGTWLDKNSSAGAYIANEYGGAASTFNNSGSYVKSGVVESDIAITFNNTSTGSLSVSAGTLGLGGGGSSTGAIDVAAGAVLNFYGGTFALSNLSPLTGTGQLLVNGATLNTTGSNGFAGQLAIASGTFSAGGPFTAATFNMSGGTLAGAGAVTIGGAATWTNGAMSGTGSTTFNGALALGSNNPHGIISRTVNFAGTTTWDNSPGGYYGGRFQTGSAATLNNTGTWLDKNSSAGAYIANEYGGAASTFNNFGTYTKSGTADVTLGIAVNNTGTLDVQAGHLYFTDAGGLQGNGTLRIGAAGAATISSGNNTVGILDHQGVSGSLDIGTKNVTVLTDYRNANFGVGNSFANHNNVTGTGKIIGSNASQAITASNGATVTNGSQANATLTLTNAHVGTNTYAYQIANTGTGASIRGAIQTTGITDPQLSGSGVTASNYGAIAAGQKSGDYTVTFTTANAGAISLLPNQVLHFASNFDNIATQNLSIVLGSGPVVGVFRLADPSTAAAVDFGSVRVGATTNQNVALTNRAANDGFSEKLNASIASSGAPVTASGSFTLLDPQATNSSSLQVGINTASAGAKTGTAVITLVSDGAGTSNLGQTTLTPQTLNVSAKVYNAAVGTLSPTAVVLANQHVGGTATQTLTVSNTAAAGAFSEALNAAFSGTTGSATRNGSVSNIAAGASNNSALSVGLDTSAAGASSGTATVAFQSDGTGSNGNSGLAAIAAGTQVVNVSGNVYRYAAADTIAAVNFGNVHVGDTAKQALTIRNGAAADGYSEVLNASFGGTSDTRITTSGSIAGLAAGASNSSSMVVGLNTSAAGTVTGTATVNLESDGKGTSGLGVTSLGSQSVGVSGTITVNPGGNVYRLASASAATPNPVDFGNVRIGTTATQALTIGNTAANDGFSEKLNASISASGTGITASGSFNLLAAQATNSSSLVVGMDTATAGAKTGSALIALASDGTGTSGLGVTALGSQTVGVSGAVYRVASPSVSPSTLNLAARVGDAAPSASINLTNSSPDAYTERLNASLGAITSGFTGSGAVTGLAAGASSGALGVAMNTSAAGSFNGSATLKLVSSGAGTTGAADLALADQSVALSGHVYTPAVAQVNTTTVDFGIVHKGDTVAARSVSVSNTAAATASNDSLQGSLGGAPAAFTATGTLAGVAAQKTDTTSFSVGLNTAAAGVFNGSATATFASHDGDLADLALGTSAIALKGQVNNFAQAALTDTGAGQLSASGHTYTLDFGDVKLGAADVTAKLSVLNSAIGPADLLSGNFDVAGVTSGFTLTGFSSFSDLASGASFGGLSVALVDDVEGKFLASLTLHSSGSNASGYVGGLDDTTLVLTGNVVVAAAVPEPGSYLLMFGGLWLVVAATRSRQRRLEWSSVTPLLQSTNDRSS